MNNKYIIICYSSLREIELEIMFDKIIIPVLEDNSMKNETCQIYHKNKMNKIKMYLHENIPRLIQI